MRKAPGVTGALLGFAKTQLLVKEGLLSQEDQDELAEGEVPQDFIVDDKGKYLGFVVTMDPAIQQVEL